MKLIKSVSTRGFEVALHEAETGWLVTFETPVDAGRSEILEQLSVALYMFELKVQDLEGN